MEQSVCAARVLHAEALRYEKLFRQKTAAADVTQAVSFLLSTSVCAALIATGQFTHLYVPLILVFLGYLKVASLMAEAFALAAHKFFAETQAAKAVRRADPAAILVPWDQAGGYVSRRFISSAAAHALYLGSALALIGVCLLVPWLTGSTSVGWTLVELVITCGLLLTAVFAFRDHLTVYHRVLDMLDTRSAQDDHES